MGEQVFRLFSEGADEMKMPQLYNLLAKLGNPPSDPSQATIFCEFDRNRNNQVECKEFLRGMLKRSQAGITLEPCDFGPDAHIPPPPPPEDDAVDGAASGASAK